jgi:hypothetical protein
MNQKKGLLLSEKAILSFFKSLSDLTKNISFTIACFSDFQSDELKKRWQLGKQNHS